MTENDIDSERMDRAERIREMRENRTNSEETTQPSPEDTENTTEHDQDSSKTTTDDDTKAPTQAETATNTQPTAPTGSQSRLLRFGLGGEQYAFDVTYVDEIVEKQEITRMPTTPPAVAGLVDLRGRVTTVLDPAKVLEPPGERDDKQLIIVFDTDRLDQQGTVGWLVDNVDAVLTVDKNELTAPPADYDWMEGLLEDSNGDGYVIVITPELVFSRTRDVIETRVNA